MLTEYWSVFAGQKHRIAKKDGDLDFSILLLWHTIGHGNLGVDALARSNIALLRSAAARAGVTPRFITTGFDQDRLAMEGRNRISALGALKRNGPSRKMCVARRLRHLSPLPNFLQT